MRNNYFILIILTLLGGNLFSQNSVMTVIKETSESFDYKSKHQLIFNTERADILVEGSDIDEILIEVKIISKHASEINAQEDLEKMNIVIEKIGRNIYCRNYIGLAADESKPESNLKVIFKVKVPTSCPIKINNTFGEISISRLNSEVELESRYSKINLAYLEGKGKIESVLGDVSIHSSYGEYEFDIKRSDFVLENCEGSFGIASKYGKIAASIKPELERLSVVGESVDIILEVEDLSSSYFNLVSTNGLIEIDKNFNVSHKLINNNDGQSVELNKEINCSKLDIGTEFGKITINKTK